MSVLLKSDWTMLWLSKHKNSAVGLIYRVISSFQLSENKRWPNTMGQCNLISYCLKEKPAKCSVIQKFLCMYELLEKHRYQDSKEVTWDLKKLIFEHLLKKSKSVLVSDLNACKELCASRGDRVLDNAKCPDCSSKEKHKTHNERIEDCDQVSKKAKCLHELSEENDKTIKDSVKKDFDHSILLWHIATNLCYQDDRNTFPNSVQCLNCKARELLSEYMLYLQVMRPSMLPNGIEQIRFQDTCAEAIEFFKERKSLCDVDQARILLEVSTEISPSKVKGDRSKSVLFEGCRLSKSLQCLEVDKMWELVSDVWVEMLCYATSKCRWNHHAQQLTQGGELVTYVWLLMAHFGITEQFHISKGHARTRLSVH